MCYCVLCACVYVFTCIWKCVHTHMYAWALDLRLMLDKVETLSTAFPPIY